MKRLIVLAGLAVGCGGATAVEHGLETADVVEDPGRWLPYVEIEDSTVVPGRDANGVVLGSVRNRAEDERITALLRAEATCGGRVVGWAEFYVADIRPGQSRPFRHEVKVLAGELPPGRMIDFHVRVLAAESR